ncbi:MAG: hypothetical protein FJ083_09360 [Cyanobacteria bacterium K_Offshore_surface_m2_239]|nr:hypothetical protein [Cyanobacteria bacterium K_Offshore_surface_m2_239]
MPADTDPPDAADFPGQGGSNAPTPATPSTPPESASPQRPWRLRLDQVGLLQTTGGIVLGLVALYSSYDHITVFSRTIQLQQQWGIVFILASVATVALDAELASRSRLRAADEAAEERDRANQERNRAAEARKRQAEGFERLDQATLLSGRVQLDPSPTNRARFQFFLTLLASSSLEGGEH